MNNRNTNFAFFDVFKFIGAIVIAMLLHVHEHLFNWIGVEDPFANFGLITFFEIYGYVFVEMFFMISGILFYTAYKSKIVSGESFDSFILKRFFRICPIAIISIIFIYFIQVILYLKNGVLYDNTGSIDLIDLAVNIGFGGQLFFTRAYKLNGPLWYVGGLMAAYCLAYALVKLSKKYNTHFLYALPIFFGFILYSLPTESVVLNHDVARMLINFFLGIYIALFLKLYDSLKIKHKLVVMLFCLCAFVMFIALKDYASNMSLAFTCFVFPELIVLFYSFKHLNLIFALKPFRYLGNISFGIYIWNFPILAVVYFLVINGYYTVPGNSMTFWWILFAIHVIVAILSHEWIEKPLGRWLKKCEVVLLRRMDGE